MVHYRTLIVLTAVLYVGSARMAAAADCTCNAKGPEADPKSVTLPYKLGSIFAIMFTSSLGVALPVSLKRVPTLSPDGDVFFMVKAFAAGIILSTGFIHILPGAFASLSSPCLTNPVWGKFPFTGFFAMLAAILTLVVESTAAGYDRRRHFTADEETADADGPRDEYSNLSLIRHRVTTQVLELGIVVHSVIIGITLGTSQSLATIKPLLGALCFHQFFEGLGLGGCIAQGKFKCQTIVTMAMFFSLTTPLGIGIGIGIGDSYEENSPTSLIIQGVFDSVACGILIYMALVGLLANDFMSHRMQKSPRLQLGANVSLLLGVSCMSVLAIWA